MELQFPKEELASLIGRHKRVIFLGIGEINLTDDGFGPYVITHFIEKGYTAENVKFINGRTVPEEREEEITDFAPDLLIIIDTCDSGDPPGTLVIVPENSLVNYLPISTHTLPIPLFISKLKTVLPDLSVYLIGLNPFSLEGVEEREFYKPDKYTLDDYERNPDLPFYAFTLTPEARKIADGLIRTIEEILEETGRAPRSE